VLHTYTSAAGGNSVINHLTQPASFKLYSKAIVESGAYDQGAANFSDVSRPFPSWNRSILTEIYLCHACSCQKILRTETAGQVQAVRLRRAVRSTAAPAIFLPSTILSCMASCHSHDPPC
jgi:carboxylesterase type B